MGPLEAGPEGLRLLMADRIEVDTLDATISPRSSTPVRIVRGSVEVCVSASNSEPQRFRDNALNHQTYPFEGRSLNWAPIKLAQIATFPSTLNSFDRSCGGINVGR